MKKQEDFNLTTNCGKLPNHSQQDDITLNASFSADTHNKMGLKNNLDDCTFVAPNGEFKANEDEEIIKRRLKELYFRMPPSEEKLTMTENKNKKKLNIEKKKLNIEIILDIFVYASIFFFLYETTLPMTIEWLKEKQGFLIALTILAYNFGAISIFIKLIILEWKNK